MCVGVSSTLQRGRSLIGLANGVAAARPAYAPIHRVKRKSERTEAFVCNVVEAATFLNAPSLLASTSMPSAHRALGAPKGPPADPVFVGQTGAPAVLDRPSTDSIAAITDAVAVC